MKYLITDPCYIISHDEWDRIGRHYGWGNDFIRNLIKGENGEEIIEANRTTYGDGSMGYKGQQMGVDAGLVCLAEVPDDYKIDGNLGILIDSFDEAKKVYAKAQLI